MRELMGRDLRRLEKGNEAGWEYEVSWEGSVDEG